MADDKNPLSRKKTGPKPMPVESRFWPKVGTPTESGCWPWLASGTPYGYGVLWDGQRQRYAHRIAYEMAIGQIPDGLQLDHLCHTWDKSCLGGIDCTHRRCVNPTHLEPVTAQGNSLRSRSFAAQNAKKSGCPNGHAYSQANTYIYRYRGGLPQRKCRTCRRAANRARYGRSRKVVKS